MAPIRRPSNLLAGRKGLLLVALTVLVGALAALAMGRLASARRELGLARSQLKAAQHALVTRNDPLAQRGLENADRLLLSAGRNARAFPLGLVRAFPLLGSPARAMTAAARAGREVAASGRVLVAASASFPTSTSSALDGQDLSAFHSAAVRSADAAAGAEAHLVTARDILAGPAGAILPPVSGAARAIRSDVDDGRRRLDRVRQGLAVLADLTDPRTELRLLLVAQDSLELRPTGGYIGSYGVLQFSKGTVRLETYQATEDLPSPQPPLAPPRELAGFLPGHWGVSNANWWPDFPTSAAVARELFKRQGGGDVGGVLAVTEYATARLVGAVGPLKLPGYAQPVVEDGFDQRALFEVELKRPLDQPRKRFLIELAGVLFDRMFRLPADRVPALADAMTRSVGAGDVQLWFSDTVRQQRLEGTVIAGRLPVATGDFLMLVDANLTASKANLGLTKNAHYRIRRLGRRLAARLEVRVRNDAAASGLNPLYNGLLRVYAPPGARLLEESRRQVQQPAQDGNFQVFSQRLLVRPGEEQFVIFEYELPPTVQEGDRYQLTWTRQAGTPRDSFRATIDGRVVEATEAVRHTELRRTIGGDGMFAALRRGWIGRALGMS